MRHREQLRFMNSLLNSGNILKSRYRILHQLGHGGFSRTYLAEDINRFNEHCVLKEFAPQLQGSFALEKSQELFEREAGVLYRLQHRQIPQFRELFRYRHQGEGHLLLVQDYVEGQTYHTLFNRRAEQGLRFSEAEINRLLNQLLPVLEYIHSMGVIHRDISPDNLILHSTKELPMLIDFGSIKEVEKKAQFQFIKSDSIAKTLSLTGTAIGKIGYAPPEQIDRGIVFAHSDLYALAATAVVLLTGKEAQKLIDPNTYYWNWQEEVTVSPQLASVLSTMLAPDPGDRFRSATEVIKNLNPSSITTFRERKTKFTPNVSLSQRQPLKSTTQIFPLRSAISPSARRCAIATIMLTISIASLWWFKNQNLTVVSSTSQLQHLTRRDARFEARFSQGERVLIPQTTTSQKEFAVAAFAKGNYDEAAFLLSESLNIFANDPEALIYLNNALIGRETSYSIAVSVPIGSNVNAAKEILRGVAQGQKLLNQEGGFNGVPLKVQIVNDDNNPEIAQQIATTLSQNPEILGVVGHYASDVTLATAKIYQSSQLVAISPVSTSVELSNLSPYLFRTVPSDYIAARALAQYMLQKLDRQNVVIFYSSQSNYSQSLKSEFTAAVSLGGGRVVNTFDLADANFSAADSFSQAIDAEATAIMLAASTDTLDKALQVVRVNRQRLSLLGGDDVYTLKTLQIAGESAEDMVLAIPWHIRANRDAEFTQVARKLWRGEVNWRTAMAYDATNALISAIASNPNPTRVGIQKSLSQPNFFASGASSRIKFLPSGDRPQQIQLVQVQSSHSSSLGYKFIPILENEK